MKFTIKEIFEGTYPEEAAQWCMDNQAKMAELAPVNGVRRYQIVSDTPYEPTTQERVVALEMKYSMYRWRRQHIIDHPDQYDAWTVEHAREIEALAASLRQKEQSGAPL